ncbi:hypothetical protein AYL99_10797 [Fonsecaea erecta]|uniref:Telomere-associated protein Rif1 N-terminal domain-containing protein n=1 Tax=Fonsecaea erecta TaxID=1367422 RepID=A0A178Z5R6_9EURO|nr:hypothetical protein AYL99_10797 [Fonsecaea erecta]OAP55097.1 hypothetical protein AYL99_10797 [Fonsecaea erecta]
MSIPDVLPLSPPSTSSRRKVFFPNASADRTSTPDSPASFPGSSNAATRKRVGFSIDTHAQPPSSASQPPSGATKRLPPSTAPQSTLKSILKPCVADGHTAQAVDGSQDAKRTMGEMMESIVQQLALDDRSVSIDAYQTLSSVIREYDDIPEEDVLKARISTITKYIRRDLQKQPNPDEPPIADTNLVTQALKVLVILVWNRDFSSLLTDEYRIFVLDRSIQVIAEQTAPKGVIIHYLHLLATQNFRPILVNSHRVTRLLEALKALTEHVKGNGVISERLLVYQKLLDQARPTMKARANLWVEELLTGMTNALKDVRTKAIAMGLKACSVFTGSSSISTTIKSILGEELAPGKTLSSAMCRKLEKMITVKAEGIQVPQIWTIILMLSNGVEDRDPSGPWPRFDKWPQFMDWLKVIQTCFNCSEPTIKQQAYMAWDRFIHIIQPHQTSDTLLALLAKPLTAQMERQSAEQSTKGTRPTAVSSYCTLLYYAFRPAATHKQYTRVWNEYIVKVMKSSFFEKSSANADIASRIFMALFWNSRKSPKLWNEKRALENTRVEPEELPTIDCKWIRAKSKAILDMFEVLMRYSSWGASGQSDRAFIAIAWSHFLKALREASSKEIKPSPETVDAMTNVISCLASLFEACSEHGPADRVDGIHGVSVAQVRHLTLAAVTELGNDLIKTGIETNCEIKKMLVIHDTLDSVMRELTRNEEDCHSRVQSEELRSEIRSLLCHCEELLDILNARLLRDFKSEQFDDQKSLVMSGIRELDQNFETMSQEYGVRLMRLLQPTLSVLLKYEERESEAAPDGCYSEIVTCIVNILFRYPTGIIEEFDAVFAAPFESPNTFVQDEAVTAWNMRFSQLDSVTFGPRLSEALLRLRNAGIDVHIPGDLLPSKELITHDTTLPSAAEDANTPTSRQTSSSPSKHLRGASPSPELGTQHSGDGAARRHEPVFPSPKRRSLRTRPRYDDSQIQDIQIDSSPGSEPDSDSQCLTEHQKEVRDKQRSEPAVVFPDLRSSPRPHSRTHSVSNCGIARKAAALPQQPSTPTLPAGHDQQEPEMPASPTPRARHVADRIAEIDVPSSPPSIPGHRDRGEITSSPPQAVAEDRQDRIVLAIVPPQAACKQIAVQANDLSPTEELNGPFPAEVEREPMNAQRGVHMPDQRSEDPRHLSTTTNVPVTTAGTRSDSDEIDILSASQLSHDLDQHLSQVVGDGGSHTLGEEQEHNSQPNPHVRRGRKRKSSSLKFTSRKRKRSEPSTETSSQSNATNSSSYAEPLEMLDCIPIAPPRAVEAMAAEELAHTTRSTASEATSAPKRRRGRQRRRTEIVSSASHSPVDRHGTIEVIVPGALRPEEVNSRESVALTSALSSEDAVVGDDQPNSGADEAVDSDEGAKTGGARPSINSMLQDVLDRLKSAEPGDVDLRALDDLCFQIRFQAQVMAQGAGC